MMSCRNRVKMVGVGVFVGTDVETVVVILQQTSELLHDEHALLVVFGTVAPSSFLHCNEVIQSYFIDVPAAARLRTSC